MEKSKLNYLFLNLVLIYLFSVCFILFTFYPSDSLGSVNKIDISFRMIARYSIPLLIFILPIERLFIKFILFTITLISLGSVIPLVPLPDVGGLIYIYYLVLWTIVGALIHFYPKSRLTPSSSTATMLLIVGIIFSVGLTFVAVKWTKEVTIEYTKHYAYEYLRCNGANLSLDNFKGICSKLTGNFWQPYYQDICFDQVESLKTTRSATEGFWYCSPYSSLNKRFENQISHYLMDYWNLKSMIGVPDSL